MGEAASSEVTQVAAATSSQDPEVGLAAVAALRGLGVWQLHASVGLPESYRGAAGSLLEALGIDPDELGERLVAELGTTVP